MKGGRASGWLDSVSHTSFVFDQSVNTKKKKNQAGPRRLASGLRQRFFYNQTKRVSGLTED